MLVVRGVGADEDLPGHPSPAGGGDRVADQAHRTMRRRGRPAAQPGGHDHRRRGSVLIVASWTLGGGVLQLDDPMHDLAVRLVWSVEHDDVTHGEIVTGTFSVNTMPPVGN